MAHQQHLEASARRWSAGGLALQCGALLMPLTALRQPEWSTVASARWLGAGILAAASAALFLSSLHVLGERWSLVARVRDEHELVTRGPYRWVRHPIYLATAGMLLAVLLTVGDVATASLAAILYSSGSVLRGRSEDALLRAAFGPRFDTYARTVPAWLPRRREIGVSSGGSP